MSFQRARSEEHREIRRRAILDTASKMLQTMTVSEMSLNELSRQTGLAKSAMLRYFESREAVLLELLDVALGQWVGAVADDLPRDTRADPVSARGNQLAALLSLSLRQRPQLCDLLAAQPGVLEHNVSADTLLRFKQSFHASITLLAEAIQNYIPEFGDDSRSVCLLTLVTTGALWMYANPSISAVRACEADPVLSDLRLDFTDDLQTALARLIAGTLVRHATR
ncbi:TetR family transcriptional regulator [Mycolicibacterium fortuitum]|uniref:TetR/AcrR family transcriptional regulator n=1 Tax=Mycolicibacterium fortuitum TaxID=1766 RepID=UPI0007EDD1B0|nr:TetR family transcriptional regulator [Mycolicibacterium fortuitum]OBJ99281.1 TetR family transcriptional regulator [Mycolicibacterium fortuitum]